MLDPLELSPAKVRGEVERIRGLAHDPETAHGAEDALWRTVLEVIRDTPGDSWMRMLAKEALETRSINFERWCS